MAQQLRAKTALSKDLRDPSQRQHWAAHSHLKSNSTGSVALYWPPGAPALTHSFSHVVYLHIIKNKIFKNRIFKKKYLDQKMLINQLTEPPPSNTLYIVILLLFCGNFYSFQVVSAVQHLTEATHSKHKLSAALPSVPQPRSAEMFRTEILFRISFARVHVLLLQPTSSSVCSLTFVTCFPTTSQHK